MQLHTPDPRFTASAGAQANFRLAVKLALAFVVLLWMIHLVSLGLELQRLGIRPREIGGLVGILFAPLLHSDFTHLISNSMPLIVLGAGMLYLYPQAAFRVLLAVWLGTGLLVWLLARPAIHIGASGLIYGLFAYVFLAGLIRRDLRALAAALLVFFLYGSLAWGVLPLRAGVSWETHLIAALIGVLAAVRFRHLDQPPRKRYAWEDEEERDEYEDSDGSR